MANKKLVTKKIRKQLDEIASVVKVGDLYDALHRVGDDPVKADIEDALGEILDGETFRLVVAVFMFATDDDLQ